jgi:hypothetical protein
MYCVWVVAAMSSPVSIIMHPVKASCFSVKLANVAILSASRSFAMAVTVEAA